jgi:hypothetical protein
VTVSIIQQTKIQAQVLVPLVKALQAELGEERANALVRGALGDLYRRYAEAHRRTKNEQNLGSWRLCGRHMLATMRLIIA